MVDLILKSKVKVMNEFNAKIVPDAEAEAAAIKAATATSDKIHEAIAAHDGFVNFRGGLTKEGSTINNDLEKVEKYTNRKFVVDPNTFGVGKDAGDPNTSITREVQVPTELK